MRNTSIKSLKSLCFRAKHERKQLWFLYSSRHRWYVSLKGFGNTRSYKSFDFLKNALDKACAKYGVEYIY